MSALSDITTITIGRTASSVDRASFGVPAIISEFDTGKTTVVFDRYRTYATAAEMVTDGWGTTDPEYNAAVILFSQNPKVENILIGRKASTDSSWSDALTAIQTATTGWYAFMIIAHNYTQTVFDADFVNLNSIVFTVNGTAVTAVPFNGTHAQTMLDIETQIEADITDSVVTVTTASTNDPDNRTVLITVDGKAPTVDVAVTLGASQPTDATGVSITSLAFDADFIAANSIVVTVNGTAVTAVVYAASHAATMAALKLQIETDITDCVCVITDSDATGRTLEINVNGDEADVSAAITGGASQAGNTVTNNLTDAYTLASAWAETQSKIFFFGSSLINIKGSGSADIASVIEALNRDRTVSMYHTASQGDATPAHMEAGWMGECLPYDAGSQTWAYKTLASVASYLLTSSERTNIIGKNCNIYTETGGNDITEEGKVTSGEWIDIIRGIDWITARLEEDIFAALIAVRKIPFTDEGVTIIEGVITAVLEEAATAGILVKSSIVVTAPEVADISAANKLNRLLPDITFTADLQGAIHLVEITGTLTV